MSLLGANMKFSYNDGQLTIYDVILRKIDQNMKFHKAEINLRTGLVKLYDWVYGDKMPRITYYLWVKDGTLPDFRRS